MRRDSDKLMGYSGPNPFHEAQAKGYSDEKIVREFFPITLYWSLFNEQHEILLGTRGSGKTVILRMLSYSCLRQFNHPRAIAIRERKNFIGFYIPLHLEFLASLPGRNYPDEERIEYFQFAFNCNAIISLINELNMLLKDIYNDTRERLKAENILATHLSEMWFANDGNTMSSLSDIQWRVRILYENQAFWKNGEEHGQVPFARHIFAPVVSVLTRISEDLGLDPDQTNWIACVDEAEFLAPPFLKCFNGFIRSEKRPLILKMATFPFRHETRETLTEGVEIEPNGNDYNYRLIDRDCDSDDFIKLTDYILSTRLKGCGLDFKNMTLENFLGKVGDDDLLDYYKCEMSETDTSEKALLAELLSELSEARREHFEADEHDQKKIRAAYLKKFSPVYYVRKMYSEQSKGNRTVGWYAGARIIRRIADGNPRRFIQIMQDLVEAGRAVELTPKNQHRIVTDFAERMFGAIEALPNYGLFLKAVLEKVCNMLHARVHDGDMVNSGSYFYIQDSLLRRELFIYALKLGMAYSWLFCDERRLYEGITQETEIRVAYLCAVHFWLPMRKGDPVILRSKQTEELFASHLAAKPPASPQTSQVVVKQLELELSDLET